MNKIAFIVPYFGKWPVWFPAFLQSCAGNPSINWLFFTDCDIPDPKPDNVLFFKSTLEKVKELASQKIGMPVNLQSPRKLCELKPAYGHIFEDYISDYDFWGFCDIDIIWGDIRAFISDEMLKEYDLITSLKETISGHFTILKNNDANRLLYRTDDIYQNLFQQEKYCWFDESAFAEIVRQKKEKEELKVYWNTYLLNVENGRDSHQEYHLDKWLYENGKLYDLGEKRNEYVEHMYLHFINWKKTMKRCEISYNLSNTHFYISYTGIFFEKRHLIDYSFNAITKKIYGYEKRIQMSMFKRRLRKRVNNLLSKF